MFDQPFFDDLAKEFFQHAARRDAEQTLTLTPAGIVQHAESIALNAATDAFRVWVQLRMLRQSIELAQEAAE